MSSTQNTEGETPAPQSQEQAPVTGEQLYRVLSVKINPKEVDDYCCVVEKKEPSERSIKYAIGIWNGETWTTDEGYSVFEYFEPIPSLTEADAQAEAEEMYPVFEIAEYIRYPRRNQLNYIEYKIRQNASRAAHVRARMMGRCG